MSQQKRKSIAILGGSFDPVHQGHIAAADLVNAHLDLSELRFMPCKIAPHKDGYFGDETHRLAMLKIAIGDRPYVVDESELSRATTSYTVQSMRLLKEQLAGDVSLAFVIGFDSLQSLHTWWHWKQLFELVNLVIVGRPGYGVDTERVDGNEGFHSLRKSLDKDVFDEIRNRQCSARQLFDGENGGVLFLPSSEKQISSSGIRKELAAGSGDLSDSLVSMLGESVAEYIKKHRLYLN